MNDPRGKSDKAPPLLPATPARTQIPSSLGPKLPAALVKILAAPLAKRSTQHQFDKSFPVFLNSVRGLANGVGRNISKDGMFIETRDPCPIGSEVRVTFTAPSVDTELTAVAEVRFQAFLNYASEGGGAEGLRGIGVRFLRFEDDGRPGKPTRQ